MQDATGYLKAKGLRPVHGVPDHRGAEWAHHALGAASVAQLNAATDPEATVPAYVNEGRWVVDCPDCNNAQLACRTDHRFMCNECGNLAIGRLWRPVRWPAEVHRIEPLLAGRPARNQNWIPGEVVELLAIENLENMGRIK